MAEAVYSAAGLGFPIVMTIGNRAIGAPINIWNDHSDSMSMRDAGWIQLYAETAQEAADLHIVAFRVAEELSCPVMVCVDGFVLTRSYEQVDLVLQYDVDGYLPAFEPRQVLDPADPVSIGAMVGREAFLEVRYLAHHKQLRALERIPELTREFHERFGHTSGGLLRTYRTEGAETIVIALGSVNGTIQEVVDDVRQQGSAIGSVSICCYPPFPLAALRDATSEIPICSFGKKAQEQLTRDEPQQQRQTAAAWWVMAVMWVLLAVTLIPDLDQSQSLTRCRRLAGDDGNTISGRQGQTAISESRSRQKIGSHPESGAPLMPNTYAWLNRAIMAFCVHRRVVWSLFRRKCRPVDPSLH